MNVNDGARGAAPALLAVDDRNVRIVYVFGYSNYYRYGVLRLTWEFTGYFRTI